MDWTAQAMYNETKFKHFNDKNITKMPKYCPIQKPPDTHVLFSKINYNETKQVLNIETKMSHQ